MIWKLKCMLREMWIEGYEIDFVAVTFLFPILPKYLEKCHLHRSIDVVVWSIQNIL